MVTDSKKKRRPKTERNTRFFQLTALKEKCDQLKLPLKLILIKLRTRSPTPRLFLRTYRSISWSIVSNEVDKSRPV